ncbi:hypothetical protein MUK42_27024 [Musa troglodytarum]|uniref:Uncharacterized protein n=1 Tax=Musa troglodytarum TaxID=320322 RepID=A0A9E7JRR2_9LILI|nr:hypothetical protein MUK42_27024 [Musa troglodytarum]
MKPADMWRTPIPYLFGGLGAMGILIAISLVILLCSTCKSSSGENSELSTLHEKATAVPPDMEPRILVVMAGDDMPTFVARPASSSARCH